VYVSQDQVPAGCEVMGKAGIAAEESRWVTTETLQAKLLEAAKAKGADAIVYQSTERASIGTSGQHSSISVFELRLTATFLRCRGASDSKSTKAKEADSADAPASL
jgi:hypothetical protein